MMFLSLTPSSILSVKFHQNRIIVAMLFIIPTIIGMALLWKSPRDNKAALLSGLSIVSIRNLKCIPPALTITQSTFFYGAYVQQLSLMSSNIAGHTKKTTINALVFLFANAGSVAGPYAYKADERAREYPTGQIVVLVMMCGNEVLLSLL
jgi:ACS family allantoate permease-like MFS transporter